MFRVRKANDRGHLNHGWLDTWHTFSFGDYYDPAYNNFRVLRVMNEDVVAPGQGFGMHGHRDMEILTFPLSGTIEHRDSLGHGEQLKPGEVQYMSAGSGIRHSEFNPSATEPLHLYQIWIVPHSRGLNPGYGQRPFPANERQGRWQQVASPDGAEGSLAIQQAARVYLAQPAVGVPLKYTLQPARHAWLQVLRGSVTVAGEQLGAGDGLAVSDEPELTVTADQESEILLFDLP